MTATEVLKKLSKRWGENLWSEIRYLSSTGEELPDGSKIFTEKSVGGEGEGERAYTVIRVEDANGTTTFYRKDGYYASYYGFEWDGDFYEVTPQQKTITVYEDKVLNNVAEPYDSFDDGDSFL